MTIWIPPAPGAFDPAPPDARRRLARRWRRILAGPQAYTTGDIGGCCCGGGGNCGSCAIPEEDLTVSWDNLIYGSGSVPLVYQASPTQWVSACTNQIYFVLACTEGQVELRVYYFLSGPCPTGQSQYCSTIRSAPYGLTQTGLTCGSSFLLTCTLTSSSCPNLSTYGYTDFTVSA